MLRKATLVVGAAGVLAAVVVVAVLLASSSGGERHSSAVVARAASSGAPPPLVAGTQAAFTYLAGQRSNRCGLTAAELRSYPPSQRLQGSCCFPMDRSTYEWQVQALRSYASVTEIPRDPYDVPVSLAQALLGYDASIRLSRAQQSTYARAMAMSRLKGPCCCRCWRWSAFRGLSKFLVADHRWSATRLALLIDDLEGCGGPDSPPPATAS